MTRYPVNHHLAQILERALAILGMRIGPVLVEGGVFNGDEPERPGQWPRVSRFGDSWAGRLTAYPVSQLELQGSHAKVHSPEHRPGAGTDQDKWSISARWSAALLGSPLYGLVEWARTSEANGFLVFRGFLAEGAWIRDRSRLQDRFENSILGTTRWSIHTLGYGFEVEGKAHRVDALPFVELSYGRMADVGGGIFDVRAFYGQSSFWSVSLGVRFDLGMPMHRMGRYGVAQDTASTLGREQHGDHDR